MTVDDLPVPALFVCAEHVSSNAQFCSLPEAVQLQISDITQQFNLNSTAFYKTIELRLQQHIYSISLKKVVKHSRLCVVCLIPKPASNVQLMI
ncbi:MAG: hypothetical protein ACTH4U_04685 [Pseudoalteromonas prydzensis]|uniref:hypothetical protein n=1 Tax=Pseudoalteromonas prydzensis TaxID=182141 RepID=UPI003F98AD82